MADKLSDKQKGDYQKAFDGFKDEYGNIPNEKLYTIMKSLGQDIPDRELALMIKYVDADDSGDVDINEFLAMMASHLGLDEPDEAKEAFICLDGEMRGMISAEDLRHIIDNMEDKLSEEQVNDVFSELKMNDKGTINLQRFKKVFGY